MKIDAAINVADIRAIAKRRLPRVVFDYIDGGAEDEVTLARNPRAFREIALKPSILKAAKPDTSVQLLGARLASPIVVGPTGLNGLTAADGDVLLAEAASDAGMAFVLSSGSNASLEAVSKRVPGHLWFQLYPWGGPDFSRKLLRRAEASGYKTIMVTVDSLVAGKRERDLRHGFAHQVKLTPAIVIDGLLHPRWLMSVWMRRGMPRMENVAPFLPDGADAAALAEFTRKQRNPLFSWADIARIRDEWKGNMLLKGVLDPDDADKAVAYGLDGVVVSNHGGRQLDGSPASLAALPAVVSSVRKRAVVLLDGGIRRGSDILKARALGADGVLLGRAPLYGLGAGGKAGVAKVLSILQDELVRTMQLVGVGSLANVERTILFDAGEANTPLRSGDLSL